VCLYQWLDQYGIPLNNQLDVSGHLQSMALDVDSVLAGTKLGHVKQALIDNGELAASKDMFGLPVFEVNEKLYFGQDRLAVMILYLVIEDRVNQWAVFLLH
jgi:2-hydroxychromene-2-carboxylate isomerase